MTTIAERIADYAADLTFADLPADVVHQAKRTLLDTLGCGFGGHGSELCRSVRRLATAVSANRPATILFTGEKTSADLAAFANGVAIRYLDFNDSYVSTGSGHPSDSISALLAAAEVAHADGRDLIVATVIAYEVFCRICDAWANKKHGIDHATMGAIASVAGAARLLGLTRAQILEAVNITVAGNVALNQTRVGDVSNWKACAYANANRNALFAAEAAAHGITGPSPVFEGRFGFFTAVSREPFDLAPFGGQPGGDLFRILRSSTKRFPLGQFSQTVVQAALQAREFVTDIADIAEIHVATLPTALTIMAGDPEKWRPRNRETADHSLPYCAGVALKYGDVDHRYFDEPYLRDEELLAFVARVKCSPSEEAARRESEMMLCELDLVLRSGERRSIRVEYHRGDWRNPMTDGEMEQKFRSLAGDILSPEQTDALVARLWTLEELGDVGDLIAMTLPA